jgi:hypothetical protein
MVLDHEMWHNKNLLHGILIVFISKVNYLVTCDTLKPHDIYVNKLG